MSLCHLYLSQTSSLHVEKLKTSLNGVSLDINDIDFLKDYDVYIIELDQATKEVSLKLRSLFKEKQNPLIYFLISSKHNLMLFQLTYLLGTKDVITQGQDTDKLITKIITDLESHNAIVECNFESIDLISSRVSFMSVLEQKLNKKMFF